MKTFMAFSEEVDQKAKVMTKLDKLKKRIEAAVNRNMGSNTKGAYDLQDKYDDLKDKARDMDIWNTWCKQHKLSPQHDARDYWA